MESQIRRYGCNSIKAFIRAGRRKSQTKADVCRDKPGSHDLEGNCRKKVKKVSERRKLVEYAMDSHQTSQRRACRVLGLNRAGFRNRAKKPDDSEIQEQLRELAEQQPRAIPGPIYHHR